jgi:hypothetical protein
MTPTRRLRDLYVSQKSETLAIYEAGRAAQLRMPRFPTNRGIHGQSKGGGRTPPAGASCRWKCWGEITVTD